MIYLIEYPPSIGIVWPLMNLASGPMRNDTTPEMSETCIISPDTTDTGFRAINSFLSAGGSGCDWMTRSTISLRVTSGAIALTRMPSFKYSIAAILVILVDRGRHMTLFSNVPIPKLKAKVGTPSSHR